MHMRTPLSVAAPATGTNLTLVCVVDAQRDSSEFHWEAPNMPVDDSTIVAAYGRETSR
jgi:hypothetical protein